METIEKLEEQVKKLTKFIHAAKTIEDKMDFILLRAQTRLKILAKTQKSVFD